MKALIVDDEKIVRQGIARAIPWTQYGFEQPLEARNGLDGLELFKQESPDVVLTDIRMPLMDGIAFTTELRKLNADVKIIFLTGYQDMEYVQAAFRNDAMDYILKPIVVADLEAALEKAARLLDERKGLHRLRVEMESKLRQSAPAYLRTLWASLAEGRFHSAAEMEEKLRFWGVDLDFDASYQVLIVTLDEYRSTPTRDQELLAFGTENILQELIESRVQGRAFQLRQDDKFVGIVPYNPEDHAGIERLVAEIHARLKAFLTQDLFVAVGTPCDGLLNLYESYESATSVILRRFYDHYAGPAYESAASLDRELVRRLISCLHDQDEGRFEQNLVKTLDEIAQNRMLTKENLRGFLLYIVGELVSGMPGDTVGADSLDLLNHCADTLYQCDTVVQVRVATVDLLRRIHRVLNSERRSPGERVVRELMEIMNRRMDQRVTINELSKSVFLTPQYMCTLFKQHTRMTIYEYITNQRVNRAKELLCGDKYKLYEIAAMVGYQDVKSFAKVFKRATGVAPSEYAQS